MALVMAVMVVIWWALKSVRFFLVVSLLLAILGVGFYFFARAVRAEAEPTATETAQLWFDALFNKDSMYFVVLTSEANFPDTWSWFTTYSQSGLELKYQRTTDTICVKDLCKITGLVTDDGNETVFVVLVRNEHPWRILAVYRKVD